ncbi:DUF3421 domain containing protein, partial [Asbolus verrucosus]
YYWRDYNGKIPEDALPGGKDANGKNVYIGQIYVHDFGLFIGTIFQGKPEIEFSCYGIRKTDNTSVIKILCTKHKESFSWLPTTSKKLHTDTIDRHAVVGGYNSKEGGIYNIARTMHEGSIQIGPTNSFTPGTAYFYFVYNNKHHITIGETTTAKFLKTPSQEVKIPTVKMSISPRSTSTSSILCTRHKESFRWVPTTSRTLHTDTIEQHAVVGGYNGTEGGIYNIAHYYWRDYSGKIPEDALPGGKDANGNDVYIAQIYVHDYGLSVGTIFQGKTEIEFSCYGIRKTDSNSIKRILCTEHKDNFRWLPTTSKTLHLDTLDKHAVVGGYNGRDGRIYNIGRVMHEGSIQIGGITSGVIELAYFYFVYNNKHFLTIENYEVLIYDNVYDVNTE